jgi:hypothetical protein
MECWSQWPRLLRRMSAAAGLLRLWVRIPQETWMFVCCDYRVLSGRGLCDELITRPEESYQLCCIVVCDLESSGMRKPWPTEGCCARNKQTYRDGVCRHDSNALTQCHFILTQQIYIPNLPKLPNLTSATSPRVDISSTCKVGRKLGVSLPLLTCSPSALPSRLLYRSGRKSRRDLWITLYIIISCYCGEFGLSCHKIK